jgi:hypothetical protein
MPVDYQAVLLGSGTTLDDMQNYRPQEESTPEGSLIMLELSFGSAISADTVNAINEQCTGVGVLPWPGNTQIAFASADGMSLSLMWVKGFAFLPAILGLLALTILPVLLGVFLWWLIPEEVKQMINAMIMMMVMVVMMMMLKPLFSSGEKSKQIEGA